MFRYSRNDRIKLAMAVAAVLSAALAAWSGRAETSMEVRSAATATSPMQATSIITNEAAKPASKSSPAAVAPTSNAIPTQPTSAEATRNRRLLPADIRECQAFGPPILPPSPNYLGNQLGLHSNSGYVAAGPGHFPWESFAQGEYVGNARTAHVPEYWIRVDDRLSVFFRRTREEISRPYELQVGDRIRVESLTAAPAVALQPGDPSAAEDTLSRELVIQPDGTITMPLIGQVRATRRTIPALRDELEERLSEYLRAPTITVTPLAVNTRLEDLLQTVDNRAGQLGGLQLNVVVTPAGSIQLPGLGPVCVQGLTLAETKQEIDARYDATIPGVEVTIDLVARAPRFLYVVGEVGQPGRIVMEGPTTLMQAIAMAGGWNIGANLRQVVVFRRGPDWRLMATMVDVRDALYGQQAIPPGEIWLNDSDIVLVPKSIIRVADEIIEQVFTRGVYAALPREIIWNLDFASGTSL